MANSAKQKLSVVEPFRKRLVGNIQSGTALYLQKEWQPTKLRALRNDALIARLAVMHDGFVVTHDVDDFQIIQRVMPGVRVMSADDFFDTGPSK